MEHHSIAGLQWSVEKNQEKNSQDLETNAVVALESPDRAVVTIAGVKSGPWLGVGSIEVSDALDSQLGLRRGEGLLVIEVITNSPAARAGLRKNDVLVELEGQRLVHPEQFRKLLQMKKEGEKVDLTLFRRGKRQVISATLEMPPGDPVLRGNASDRKSIGMGTQLSSQQAGNDSKPITPLPKKTASQKNGAQASKAQPSPMSGSYFARQGWKADFRTLVAMAKWLVAPEPSPMCCPPPTEPISTSITEVIHGRNLGNI